MILIADSGSTKTDWVLCSTIKNKGNDNLFLKTQGINPFYQQKETIIDILQQELFCKINDKIKDIEEIYFYGAGCTKAKSLLMRQTIYDAIIDFSSHITLENIKVGSDLLAAAHATCGKKPGIACILGTGSNSGLYDGHKITKNISPLGFILGDEGSGAMLGKLFLNAAFKEQLSSKIKDAFLAETHQTYEDVIERVYRKPLPNRYLASISHFVAQHLNDFALHPIVEQNFNAFFEKNICRYDHSKEYDITVVGSIGKVFEEILRKSAEKYGYKLTKVLAAPIEGLINYHLDI